MKDLTVIMLTPNKVPQRWAKYHKKKLLEAIGDTQVITVSSKPLNWGMNLIQSGYGIDNIYRYMLLAFQGATTPYIAMADDDTLYPKDHFAYRPAMDKFAYNYNRWHLFTWGPAFYFHKPRPGNGLMIAPRELAIRALERRLATTYAKKRGLTGHLGHELGTSEQAKEYDVGDMIVFYTTVPVVSFYHEMSVDPLSQRRRKYAWPVRAYDLPLWGKAAKVRKYFR